MADSPLKTLLAELDAALKRGMDLEERMRELDRARQAMDQDLATAGKEAQGLRIAIMALNGQPIDNQTLGKANTENEARRKELRQSR